MSKLLSVKVIGGLLVAGLVFVATSRQAEARPLYNGWWPEVYPDVAKQNDFAKVKCNVCHFGMKKTNRNAYGKAIQKALPKKNLKKGDKQVFLDALQKVEGEKSEVEGKTFGDLLKDNMLPSKPK